ncbi:MAG: HAMP domain-containing protein [Acidobacteria bacterium]|nr:HAMP domain-containing protein [Acidobacteriota bacterium]
MAVLSSLTNRIFLASAILAVLSIAAAVYVVNVSVTAQAEAELQRGLEEASALVQQYRALVFDNFTRQAHLVADLPRLKAAVSEDDPPTVLPIATEYRRQIDSDRFVVTNSVGRVLADVGATTSQQPGDMSAIPAVRRALAGRETAWFWPQERSVLQVVTVPVWIGLDQPQMLGTLSVGFHLDEALARRFKRLTESEIAFAFAGRVQSTTLAAARTVNPEALIRSTAPVRLSLGGDDYVALMRPLDPGARLHGSAEGTSGGRSDDIPTVIVLRSRSEQLRFLSWLHRALGLTAIIAVLAATLLSYGVARTITRPLGAITAAMREMAATGDLTRKLTVPGDGFWEDEDARVLASTFNTMTGSIARFQREAALRERLSSLGRLSTIVAHEIRNPLMIIKTSLRTLKRHGIQPGQLHAAVADIEEETARLNRIVSEVLDFARPIQFEYAPADVNALCEAAAAASAAGETWPLIRMDLDSRVPPIVIDAERVRLTLVNILTNARQAVITSLAASRPPGAPDARRDEEDIVVSTRAQADGSVAIGIRDRGAGMAADDLTRIFEPYFTTKRAGTGLGLAIAKNVIEGMGGSIGVSSTVGQGTEIRIVLGSHPQGTDAAGRAQARV